MIVLGEAAVTYLKNHTPLLVDPSPAELGKLWRSMQHRESIKFTAVARSRTFYAFDGYAATHWMASLLVPELSAYPTLGDEVKNPPSVFTGDSVFAIGMLRFTGSDTFGSRHYSVDKIREALRYDWSFANRYLQDTTIEEFLEMELRRREVRDRL